MAAPYCTVTGTIPGGQNGKATVRITPDVDGATATRHRGFYAGVPCYLRLCRSHPS